MTENRALGASQFLRNWNNEIDTTSVLQLISQLVRSRGTTGIPKKGPPRHHFKLVERERAGAVSEFIAKTLSLQATAKMASGGRQLVRSQRRRSHPNKPCVRATTCNSNRCARSLDKSIVPCSLQSEQKSQTNPGVSVTTLGPRKVT